MLNEARLTYSNTEVNLVSLRSHTPSFHIPPSKKHKPPLPPMFSPNELGKLARASARELARHGWPRFFKLQQRYTSTSSSLRSLPHPFAPMLHRYATQGVPAPSTAPPWSLKQKDRAGLRLRYLSKARNGGHGPHGLLGSAPVFLPSTPPSIENSPLRGGPSTRPQAKNDH
jgi:hypothetical protein